MSIPCRVRNLSDYGSFCNIKSPFFDQKKRTENQSQLFFGGEKHTFSTTSSKEDITSAARKSNFSSFFGREKDVLVNSTKEAYQNIISSSGSNIFFVDYDPSSLAGTHVSLDAHIKSESCLTALKNILLKIKNILLKIWSIIKRLFCIEKEESRKTILVNEQNQKLKLPSKHSLRRIEKKFTIKNIQKQQHLKKINLKKKTLIKSSLAYQYPVERDINDLMSSPLCVKNPDFFSCKILKDMWTELEEKNESLYQWACLTMLTQVLMDFSKLLRLRTISLFPIPQVGLDIYFKWEEQKQSTEDTRAIICALFDDELIKRSLFSQLLEGHGAENEFVKLAEELEDILLPSQIPMLLALIAKDSSRLTSVNARFMIKKGIFSKEWSLVFDFVNKSLFFLSLLKENNEPLWSNLIQVLANDAFKN